MPRLKRSPEGFGRTSQAKMVRTPRWVQQIHQAPEGERIAVIRRMLNQRRRPRA